MENKASLSLMEQVIMILVFALAAALCLGVFARAGQIGEETTRRETGAVLAQNGAEHLKSGGSLDDLFLPDGYSVEFVGRDTDIQGLKLGVVEVHYAAETEPVFAVDVAWQEAVS